MENDSPDDMVPLARAMLTWTDPSFVGAIRTAEAAFPPGKLATLDRDTVEAVLTKPRVRPRRGRSHFLDGRGVGALDQAWDDLKDAFRGQVARGEVRLVGLQIEPIQAQAPEEIPAVWGPILEFDVRGNALFLKERTYALVQAAKTGTAGAGQVADTAMSKTPMPLSEAVVRWSDPMLVEAVKAQERRLTPHQLSGLVDRPRLSREDELRQPGESDWMLGGPANLNPLIAAWQALERAFKAKLVREELFASGVMLAPKRGTASVPLPGVWAADFEFDLLSDGVTTGEERYTAVTITPVANTAKEDAAVEATIPPPEPEGDDHKRGEAGRRPFPLEEMVELAMQHDGPDWPSHKVAAHQLLTAFKARYVDRRPPAERTVLDHVNEIYTQRAARRRSAESAE